MATGSAHYLPRRDPVAPDVGTKYSQLAWLKNADPRAVSPECDTPAPHCEIGWCSAFTAVENVHTGPPVVLDHDGTPPSGRVRAEVEIAQVAPALLSVDVDEL
jgi:hypothetical protein